MGGAANPEDPVPAVAIVCTNTLFFKAITGAELRLVIASYHYIQQKTHARCRQW